jgi:hypothetical protein
MSTEDQADEETFAEVAFDSLVDMDIVIYSRKDGNGDKKFFGAVLEDGRLAPLSAYRRPSLHLEP